MNRTRFTRSMILGLALVAGCKDNTGTQLASDYDKNAQARATPAAVGEGNRRGDTSKDHRLETGATLDGSAGASPSQSGALRSQMGVSQDHRLETGATLTGKVAEAFDAGGYTYLRLTNKSGEAWAAISKTPVTVGQTLELGDVAWMQDFSSPTLNRKFDRIAFAGRAVLVKDGADVAAGAPAGRDSATGMPNDAIHGGAPGDGQGGHKESDAGGHSKPSSPHATPGGGVTVKAGDVAKLDGGLTIEEVFAQKDNLVGKTVRLRAKVVKANAGILGSNWYHIQDGTGGESGNDITITSQDTAKVGDTVVVEGVLGVNKDIGSGYFFPIIIEKAKVAGE